MEAPIQTPILSILAKFFLLLGYRTYSTQWKRWQCYLCLLWIILMNGMTMYTLVTEDVLGIADLIRDYSIMRKRSYFGYIIDSSLRYLLPVLFPFKFFFYTYHLPSIIRLLDSPCLARFYVNYSKWKALALTIVFCIAYNFFILDTISGNNVLSFIQHYLALYLSDMQDLLVWAVLYYAKYATYLNLLQLNTTTIRSATCLQEFKVKLKLLASINHRLSVQTSGLLLVYSIMRLVDVLNLLFMVMVLNQLENGVFLTFNAFIVFGLTRIQASIDALLHKLHVRLATNCCCFRLRSITVDKYELQIYNSYFKLRMFHLCRLDMHLLLAAGLYMANYFLFTMQTLV